MVGMGIKVSAIGELTRELRFERAREVASHGVPCIALLSARFGSPLYLTLQPREKARQFLMKYQDRILYGTDLAFFVWQDAAASERKWAEQYATDWVFFSSKKTVTYRGKEVQGLGLPPKVLRKP